MARGPHPWKYSAPSYIRSKAHTLRRLTREKYAKEMKKDHHHFMKLPQTPQLEEFTSEEIENIMQS